MLRRLLSEKTLPLSSVEALPVQLMIANAGGEVTHLTAAMMRLLASIAPALQQIAPDLGGTMVGRNLFGWLDLALGRKLGWEKLFEGQAELVKVGSHWFELSAVRLRDSGGHAAGFAVGWSDASSQRRRIELEAQAQAIGRAQIVVELAPDGRITAVNDNFCRLMGYTAEEVVGQHHRMLVPLAERDAADYREFWAAINRGEDRTGLFRRQGKDDRAIWITASCVPVLDDAGRTVGVLEVGTDITARKREAVELASCMAAIGRSQAVIEFDLSGRILDANDNFLQAVGYSLADIRGRHHSMFVDSAEQDSDAYRAFWTKLGEGSYQAGEFRRVGNGGREVWIQASYNPVLDPDGRPFKVIKFAMDTTPQVVARMKSEHVRGLMETVAAGAEELNSSVREISDAMVRSRDTVVDAVARVDAADDRAKRLSDAARSMSGIVELIQEITGQINLLALNATIESARAGDAGRGFSVVAAEVKTLANQTRQATERIGSEIDALNGISSEVLSSLGGIKSAIENVSQYVSTTAAAIEQQSAVTGEMSASMQRAAMEAASIGR